MSKTKPVDVRAFGMTLQAEPRVYLTALPGRWLVNHSTPSWRAKDPIKGFQRIVKEDRAKAIARHVISEGRTFPNAITLATTVDRFTEAPPEIVFPAKSKFLVVDGQHRLFAQKFAEKEALYPCVIHMGRTESDMAKLFIEINDTQRRVPSSLRWDLYRLVRDEDESLVATSDIVYELTVRKESPFYSADPSYPATTALDRTGEDQSLTIKQGSLAPEIKRIVARHVIKNESLTPDECVELLIRFFVAIRSLDPKGWGNPKSAFFKARVLRALLRVLDDLMKDTDASSLTGAVLRAHFLKIDQATLSDEEVRKVQGSAGVQDLYTLMKAQVLPK